MSTPTRHAPTRRTVLRAAVWTAPAVSIAVAAPAFACSVDCMKGAVGSTQVEKFVTKGTPYVRWTLTFTNTGSDLSNPLFDFSCVDSSGKAPMGMEMTPAASWSTPNTALLTTTYQGTIKTGNTISLIVLFVGASNATGTVDVVVSSGKTIVAQSARYSF